MRLLHTTTLKIEQFLESGNPSSLAHFEGSVSGVAIPKYAILSHTWGDEEVSFQDMQGERELIRQKAGYRKLRDSCAQSLKNGYDYIWIDTCCIDKSSSAELSESINSMYRWYKKATICYVYLEDANGDVPFQINNNNKALPRWYSRGWTLQELIAPGNVRFYNKSWKFLGTKLEHMTAISNATGIDLYALGGGDLTKLTIARRMSWVANRKTTRSEDIAYCLLGIFDINMPLLYGEGENAFIRLQQEIMNVSGDQSIFAWRDDDSMEYYREDYGERYERHGLLASSPTYFRTSGVVAQFQSQRSGRSISMSTNQGLKVDLLMCQDTSYQSGQVCLAVLDCQLGTIPGVLAGIRLKCLTPGGEQFARIDIPQLFQFALFNAENEIDFQGFDPTKNQFELVDLKLRTPFKDWMLRSIYIRQDPQSPLPPGFWLVAPNPFHPEDLLVKEAYPPELWDRRTRTLQPANLGFQRFKIGALHVYFQRRECILILGIERSEVSLQPWCYIENPNQLHSTSPLEERLQGFHIDYNKSSEKNKDSLLKSYFNRFRLDQCKVSVGSEGRKHINSHEDLQLVSVVEPITVSGREMFIVRLLSSKK
ncbi:heterokaryon incompatibility protein-domain-containing protein [Tricladium varicosporioides]|nr:heterokaryon incompatibility protein-domain-containing protein [Hymenoscyphus varicosporioides]